MNRSFLSGIVSAVGVAGLLVCGHATALADDGTGAQQATILSLYRDSSFLQPVDHSFTTVVRSDSGIEFHIHGALDPSTTAGGQPVKTYLYIFNRPADCNDDGQPIAHCSPRDLATGVGDPHIVAGPDGYVTPGGRLNVSGTVPVGSALRDPANAEVQLLVRAYSATDGQYHSVALSIQDP